MDNRTWLERQNFSLQGKTVVLTGATGGLGGALCRCILALGGSLVMVNRSPEKTQALTQSLLAQFPGTEISAVIADLTDMTSVKAACEKLKTLPVDVLLHNAGAYAIPRRTCDTGWDNVFQINFVSPYCITKELLPVLAQRKGKVAAVGSIAHALVQSDPQDVDFSRRKMASRVYGNSKRYLMFSLAELLKDDPRVGFGIGHPGISPTNITSGYPKWLRMLIKWPMKAIFISPDKAARGVMLAVCRPLGYLEWAGPRIFSIWGDPSVKKLTHCPPQERERIWAQAEKIYRDIFTAE